MPKKVTVAASNRYCQARMRAALYNEKLLSRSGAAEVITGITEDSLKKYELGIVKPPNDVVALMADAYNEPELRNWYCANECPLGRDTQEIEFTVPEHTAIRLYNAITGIQQGVTTLFHILDGGEIKQDDLSAMSEAKTLFIESKKRLDEVLVMIEKIEKCSGIDTVCRSNNKKRN